MLLPAIQVSTRAKHELVDITATVRGAVRKAGVKEGIAVVFVPHTTAAVTIQENADPDVPTDVLLALENAVPEQPARGVYRHEEGNSPAHVKSSMFGSSVTIVIDGGELLLGTWQGVFFCEFDGPRKRTVHVKVVPG